MAPAAATPQRPTAAATPHRRDRARHRRAAAAPLRDAVRGAAHAEGHRQLLRARAVHGQARGPEAVVPASPASRLEAERRRDAARTAAGSDAARSTHHRPGLPRPPTRPTTATARRRRRPRRRRSETGARHERARAFPFAGDRRAAPRAAAGRGAPRAATGMLLVARRRRRRRRAGVAGYFLLFAGGGDDEPAATPPAARGAVRAADAGERRAGDDAAAGGSTQDLRPRPVQGPARRRRRRSAPPTAARATPVTTGTAATTGDHDRPATDHAAPTTGTDDGRRHRRRRRRVAASFQVVSGRRRTTARVDVKVDGKTYDDLQRRRGLRAASSRSAPIERRRRTAFQFGDEQFNVTAVARRLHHRRLTLDRADPHRTGLPGHRAARRRVRPRRGRIGAMLRWLTAGESHGPALRRGPRGPAGRRRGHHRRRRRRAGPPPARATAAVRG